MKEYRLMYHWDSEHWTAISVGTREDICKYIDTNLAEMREAIEDNDDAYYSIAHYHNNTPMDVWHGTLDELYAYLID